MRTKKELQSEEFCDDMTELQEVLNKAKISYSFKRHEGATPELLKMIGYYPTGEWHIKIGKVSVIRGMVSFGLYEAYGGKFKEPERFETPKDLLKALKA